MRILLVEDDESLGEGIRTALRRAAFSVDWLRDGASALAAIKDGGIDLVVLDLGLPHMDGMEVIRQARQAGVDLPILVLSARERASDRTQGLDAGADDYLGKPFDTQELLARVRALLRRTNGRTTPMLRVGALELDPARLAVVWRGKLLDLPRREFALLRLLMEHRGRPISRESAQQRLYGWDEDVASNALDVHIHALRKKLDPALIRTLRGIGYALDEKVAQDSAAEGPRRMTFMQIKSIRRALLLSIIGVTSLVLLIAAGFSYRAGLQEAGELFDAKLAHSSRVLMSLVDEPFNDLAAHSDGDGAGAEEPLVIKVWRGQATGTGEALAMADGHAYETKLAFQVRDARGALLLRSDSGPDHALAPLAPGFANLTIDGEHWRTFTLKSPSGRWYQSGELSAIREEIAEEIAFGTLLPLLAALPLLALCVWFAVGWACASLQRVSDAVELRAPDRLEAIELARVPNEIQGIVKAVNGLLERLDNALSRERRFTADAAHELRTPIAALKVHAYNLRQSNTDSEREQSQQYLDAGIQRMERLVAQLLALSRIENGGGAPARRSIDLAATVQRHEREYAALGATDGRRIVLTAEPAMVLGDEPVIDALVRNLLDNAVRYAPPDGVVTVRVGHDGNRVILAVEDSGPGVPEEARQRVFDRFHRELGTGVEGSGLGLSIVAQALQLHGGEIALDTSPTLGGLRATVTLPAL